MRPSRSSTKAWRSQTRQLCNGLRKSYARCFLVTRRFNSSIQNVPMLAALWISWVQLHLHAMGIGKHVPDPPELIHLRACPK